MFEVEEFVAECKASLRESEPQLAVKEVVQRAVARATDVEARLGAPGRGGIVSLHRDMKLTVLHVVWPPGVSLYPHEHRMWAVNGIYGGREDNTFYRRTPEGLVTSGARTLDAGDVAVLGDKAIHSVVNPRRGYTGAIHVYGGDYFDTPRSQWDPDTLEERPFDVEELKRVLTATDEASRVTDQ